MSAPETPEAEYQDEEMPEARPGWHIPDLGALDWALSRVADLEREQAENLELERAAIERIRLRTLRLNESAARGVAFFGGRIREYAELHRAELLGGGKKKSRKLLHGTVGWRSKGGGLSVTDAEALLAWARAQPVEAEVLRIKEDPALKAIKALFEATGEVPDGCDVEPETEEFNLKAEAAL